MKIYNELKKFENENVIALGAFDGLHIAHKYLINKTIEFAKINNISSMVCTFTNLPKRVVQHKKPLRILQKKKKELLIDEFGIDYLVTLEFDEYIRNMSHTDFIKDFLIDKLNAKIIVVGYDYRFGKNREGDINILKKYADEYNYSVYVVDKFMMDNNVVSSTLIREKLSQGDIKFSNLLLGRKYSLIGKVKKGKQLGKIFGFPTANLFIKDENIILKSGVYITNTLINNKIYNSITNIGNNPTFNEKRIVVETYIFDFNEVIYDEQIEVFFIDFIREEIKFNSKDELIKQIDSDVMYAKEFLKGFNEE